MPRNLDENRPVIMSVNVMLAAMPRQFPPVLLQPSQNLPTVRLD
jgi:hypothetical protein